MLSKIELTVKQAEELLSLKLEDEVFTWDEFMRNTLQSTHGRAMADGYGDGLKEGIRRGYLGGYSEGMRDRTKDH